MLNVITKKYIIKHTFGEDDDLCFSREAFIEKYKATIYPYPERIRPQSRCITDVYKLMIISVM